MIDTPPDIIRLYRVDVSTSMLLPMFTETGVHCGFPSPAMDYVQQRVDLNKMLIKNPEATFVCDCSGDSMIDAFIAPVSRLIVDRSEIPCNNDIILVAFDGGFIVRTLEIKNNVKRLIPQNRKKNLPIVTLHPETGYEFWGVVTQILIDPRVRYFNDRFS